MNVLILGADGMLGNQVYRYLKKSGIKVFSTSRKKDLTDFIYFDAGHDIKYQQNAFEAFKQSEYIVNCIGIIKPRINEKNVESIIDTLEINSIFPKKLEFLVRNLEKKCISIATDCVYNGTKGSYSESSSYSPVDLYGKTKLLGEVSSDNSKYLRCSIIGPEIYNKVSLFEWFKSINYKQEISGYENHLWNGITTIAFSKVLKSIIKNNLFKKLPPVIHLVPKNELSKYQLLNLFKTGLERNDIKINKITTEFKLDRTLVTNYQELNDELWKLAGYKSTPTIEELVIEMFEGF